MKTFIALSALALVAASQANTSIDTLSTWSGSDYVGSFGVTDTSTYGQTFVVPNVETELLSYTFVLRSSNNPVSFHPFNFYLMGWDTVNGRATGSLLFKSGTLFSVDTNANQTFTVGPKVNLVAGNKYVAFISTSEANRNVNWSAAQGYRSDAPYNDGEFVFLNNGSDTSAWTNQTWNSFAPQDTAFHAEFCTPAVPEPASMTALAMGALALIRRKRSSK